MDVPLTAEDLVRLGAAELDESATGDVATGKAIEVGGVYYREYRPYTPEELAAPALAALAATDADMPRIVEDMWQALVDKGLISDSDLPQQAQDKLQARRDARAAL